MTNILRRKYDTEEQFAKEFAGNWGRAGGPDSCWAFNEEKHPEYWGLLLLVSRDTSECSVEASNFAVMEKRFKKFLTGKNPSLKEVRITHWACGWIDGFGIKVYQDKGKKFTKAFLELIKIQQELERYSVLDDDDYFERRYKFACESVKDHIEYRLFQNKIEADAETLVYEFRDKYPNDFDAIDDTSDCTDKIDEFLAGKFNKLEVK